MNKDQILAKLKDVSRDLEELRDHYQQESMKAFEFDKLTDFQKTQTGLFMRVKNVRETNRKLIEFAQGLESEISDENEGFEPVLERENESDIEIEIPSTNDEDLDFFAD